MNKDFNLTTYIQTELENFHNQRECLKSIGKSFDQYLNYENLLEEMNDCSITELEEAINNSGR